MPHSEAFSRPLVKTVIFQITFPNLFFLENRIGEFQIGIMRQFPKSQLLIQRQMLILNVAQQEMGGIGPDAVRSPEDAKDVRRIWRFESDHGVILDVSTNSLSLLSNSHKGYDVGELPHFRETVASVCEHLVAITELPIINRVGLRYIDECPSAIVGRNSDEFRRHYNTAFPLDRFPLETASEMHCRVTVKRGSHMLRYQETMTDDGNIRKLGFDFDAWSENIEPPRVTTVTDELHEIISDEFHGTVKEPVLQYMRGTQEVKDG